MNPKEIILGNLNINDPAFNVATTDIQIWDSAQKQIYLQQLAQVDGGVSTFQRYQPREFMIKGWVRGNDIKLFEQKLDSIKRQTISTRLDLKIQYIDSIRTYEVIVKNVRVNRGANPNLADFQITAVAENPVGVGDEVTFPDTTINSPPAVPKQIDTTFYTASGDIPTFFIQPKFTFQVTSWNQSVPADSVDTHLMIGNPDSNEYLKFIFNPNFRNPTTIVNNDIFVVDCLNFQTTKNSVDVYAEGVMPRWDPNSTTSKVRISSNPDASWTILLSASFNKRYL